MSIVNRKSLWSDIPSSFQPSTSILGSGREASATLSAAINAWQNYGVSDCKWLTSKGHLLWPIRSLLDPSDAFPFVDEAPTSKLCVLTALRSPFSDILCGNRIRFGNRSLKSPLDGQPVRSGIDWIPLKLDLTRNKYLKANRAVHGWFCCGFNCVEIELDSGIAFSTRLLMTQGAFMGVRWIRLNLFLRLAQHLRANRAIHGRFLIQISWFCVPQFDFYKFPSDAKSMTFGQLLDDCFRQLVAIRADRFPLSPLLTKPIMLEHRKYTFMENAPDATSLHELSMLLDGHQIVTNPGVQVYTAHAEPISSLLNPRQSNVSEIVSSDAETCAIWPQPHSRQREYLIAEISWIKWTPGSDSMIYLKHSGMGCTIRTKSDSRIWSKVSAPKSSYQ
jgi:hypothetical protein